MTRQLLRSHEAACEVETWEGTSGSWHLVTRLQGEPAALSALLRGIADRPVCVTTEAELAALVGQNWVLLRDADVMRRDLHDAITLSRPPVAEVRPLRAEDLPALARVAAEAYSKGHPDHRAGGAEAQERVLRALLDDPDKPAIDAACLVAEVDARPVGGAVVQQSDDFQDHAGPWLMTVFRGQEALGVGRVLLAAVVEAVRARGHDVLWLAVTRGNPAADLYRAVGFVTAARVWVLAPGD